MKISSAKAAGFCARPAGDLLGILIHGPDAALSARLRRAAVAAVSEGEDLRVAALDPAAVQKDPAQLHDALRARGFFPGRRVVVVEDAKDGLAKPARAALEDLTPEDALLVITAGQLTGSSGLRKLFETGEGLASVAAFPEPADPHALIARLAREGAKLTPEAEQALAEIAADADGATTEGLVTTLALFAGGREAPVEAAELAALAPARLDAAIDRLVDAVARGEHGAIGPLTARLTAQGVRAEAMLAALRAHFRQALAAAADPGGPRAAAERLYRGRFNPRRDAFLARMGGWDLAALEFANRQIFEAERTLRSPGERPDAAIVERCMIRLAVRAGRH